VVINDYTFEKVKEFKYLGMTITNNNDWSTEIISRIRKQRGLISRYINFSNQNYFPEGLRSDYT
jgi:hypothetical protein